MSEQVIASRTATARVVEAELAMEPAAVMALRGRENTVDAVLEWFRGFSGVPWVGGRATLTERRLHFEADSLNKMVHVGPTEVDVDLRHVVDVAVKQGLAAGTIDVLLPGAVLQLRCLGAQRFAGQVRRAAAECR